MKISSYLFVCLFRGGVFRAPCMNFISCQSSVTSYQKSVKCQRLSHYIVLFISDALPHRTSTGDGFAAGLIWIIRRRRMRYLCSRCVEISSCDIAGDGHQQTAVCTSMHYVDRHICMHEIYAQTQSYVLDPSENLCAWVLGFTTLPHDVCLFSDSTKLKRCNFMQISDCCNTFPC